MSEEKKHCSKCGELLTLDCFYKSSTRTHEGYNLQSYCKKCLSKNSRVWEKKKQVQRRKCKQEIYKNAIENRLCVKCHDELEEYTSSITCHNCLNRGKLTKKIKRKERIENGICTRCGKNKADVSHKTCEYCRDFYNKLGRTEEYRLKRRDYAKRLKDEVYNYYGGYVCYCCGETEEAFLTLDHINDDGSKHRKEVGVGKDLFLWIRKNNFPNMFRVLCQNCNAGRYRNGGTCPHKEKIKSYSFSEYIDLHNSPN